MGFIFEDAIEDVETLDTFDSMIIFGDSGRGKTNLGASAIHAGFKRVLIVDIEGSAKGVARLNPGVKRIKAPTFEHLEVIKDDILRNPSEVDLVIFDTTNAGQKMAEAHFKGLPQNRLNKFGAWEDLRVWTNDWFRSFHNSPIPTIFIAHALDDKNEQTGAVKTTVKATGSAKEDIPTIPDIVGYLAYENVNGTLERVLYVGESETLVTKNRFGLPSKIYQPSMKKIVELIKQASEEAKGGN
jgi:hypothetical protein